MNWSSFRVYHRNHTQGSRPRVLGASLAWDRRAPAAWFDHARPQTGICNFVLITRTTELLSNPRTSRIGRTAILTLTLKPLCEQVMITGASSGIGRVTARMAATRGAKVVLIAHNEAAPAEIVGEIRANGGVAEFAVADVGDRIALSAAPLQHSIYTSAKLPPAGRWDCFGSPRLRGEP